MSRPPPAHMHASFSLKCNVLSLFCHRKDVLMKSGKLVGGGDSSRKKKLLDKQKKGKARAKTVGRVQLSQEAFWAVLSAGGGGAGGAGGGGGR